MKMNWNYIAGYFDGEGSIWASRKGKGLKVTVAFSNTNKESLNKMCEYTKLGSVYPTYRRKQQPHWKQAYLWEIQNHGDALKFIKKVMNLCIIKKKKLSSIKKQIKEHKWRLKRSENIKLIKALKKEVSKEKTDSLRLIAKRLNVCNEAIYRDLIYYGLYKEWRKKRMINFIRKPKKTICEMGKKPKVIWN